MEIAAAQTLAESLMQEHNVDHFTFQFDSAKRRFGCCHYTRKVISLSRPLVLLNSEDTVRRTILHEIAHALTPGHHHDDVWRRVAIKLGDTGERCYNIKEVVRPKPKYLYTCSNCGHKYERFKRIKQLETSYHGICGSKLGKLKQVQVQNG